MNNDEAMAALVAQRTVINAAINGLNRYKKEGDDWTSASKATRMAEVKSDALSGGVDISTWDGTPAPPPPPDVEGP
jgi:hypothetical protein